MDSMVTMVNNTLKLLRVNLKTSHLKKQNSITMYGDNCDYFMLYTNIESLCCIRETILMLYFNYISIKVSSLSLESMYKR